MIKDKVEQAVSLGLGAELEWSVPLKKSVVKMLYFLVGMLNENGKTRKSHKEPINVAWLSDDRKADVQAIDDATRRIWDDMTDEALYYDRPAEAEELRLAEIEAAE